MTQSLIQTIVIGAGICGSTIARVLHDKKTEVFVFDKSRGFGGRMATRRIGENQFNHGAPHIHGSSQFIRFLNESLPPGFLRFNHNTSNYLAPLGMNNITKLLLKDIPTQLNTKITHLQKMSDHWIIKSNPDKTFRCKILVITAPLPQALDLLDSSDVSYDLKLREIVCDPALVLLIPGNPSTTLICSKDFSIKNFDSTDEEVLKKIQSENSNINMSDGFQIKRWKYAVPRLKYKSPFYKTNNLYLAGDSFGGPTLEGSFLSGIAAANDILGFASK